MLGLRIEYLTGRCVATAYNDRERAEWPPHPARVHSALVATWAESETPDAAERVALEWLERAGPPTLSASDASHRDVVPHFVPVNDAALPSDRTAPDKAMEAARKLFPETRGRQPRHFPSVTPENPVAHLVWAADPPEAVRASLARLAARVARIGHSSSLVACALVEDAPPPSHFPDPGGEIVLRVPGEGQFARLVEDHELHRGIEPRVLPCRFQRYRQGAEEPLVPDPVPVLSDAWIVFRRVGGPRLPITRTADVAAAMRGALLVHADDPPPEALSGHGADGQPVESPHVAFVPLPFVGREHADGSILGIAVVLPRALAKESRRAVLAAIGRFEEAHRTEQDQETPPVPLLLGKTGRLEVERVAWGPPPLAGLRPETWCHRSRVWVSATPVALDRNPGDLRGGKPSQRSEAWRKAEETIALACERIGLPRPQRVVVLPSVSLAGTRKAVHFPPYPSDPKKIRRVKVHARIEFPAPVRGPVLIGAGRYFGLGLFRPVGRGRGQ